MVLAKRVFLGVLGDGGVKRKLVCDIRLVEIHTKFSSKHEY